ncbi:MAG: DNA replication and repair protein RecF [Treponema sp.]|nr:DNA replication and repair protein RecF [Treponema sp.]
MFFNSLRITSFRNLKDAEIFTGAKDVFLVGENGQGKSNFLEALYFCAYASSFRAIRDSEMACNDKKDFCAQVKLSESANDDILVKIENGKKSILINGKIVNDRKEMLSIAPCIIFCHEDMEFVNGTPERRRWFFDQSLSLYDPVYLDDLRRYRRVLKSRNTLLKDFSQRKTQENPEQVLDVLDPQLAMYGFKLMEKRKKAVQDFSDVFGPLYEEVSGISGISVQYTQSWKDKTEDEIVSHLHQKRQAELAAGLSLTGPHRDRYVFTQILQGNITDFTVKASTGQRRLLALLLRTAQARLYSSQTRQNPVLLLDDVLLEMDGKKRRKFLSVLPGYDQAFYTFLPEEPYHQYRKDDTLIYFVKEGELSV